MSTETTRQPAVPTADPITRRRIGIAGLILATSAVLALPGGVLWPEPSGGGDTYAYGDIQPLRDRWWGLLVFLSANLVLNVLAQALLTVYLVRRRGAAWATVGGLIMWIGTALYAVGVGGWAAAYYFATAPGVDPSAMDRIGDDTLHLLGPLMIGSLLVALGTLVQAVGLFRSHAVPRWIPVLWLTIVLTFVIPGNGWVGLLTAVPMCAASIGTAYYAWRRSSAV
ncbi:hypothetical protein ACQPYH_36580 [Kribbella sp. CA-245084]|uniref:hypothetical protein n=1 Tax=Kribbella sp. CA-245084 TaxID=3239940 RepID=UPI003D8A09BA